MPVHIGHNECLSGHRMTGVALERRIEELLAGVRRAYTLDYNVEPCWVWWNPARRNGAGGKDVTGLRKDWQRLGRLPLAEIDRRIVAGEANGYLIHGSTSVPRFGGATLLDGDTEQECARISAAVGGIAPHVRSGAGGRHWYVRGVLKSSVTLKTKDTAFGPGTWYTGPDGAERTYVGALPEPAALPSIIVPMVVPAETPTNGNGHHAPDGMAPFFQPPKPVTSAARQWEGLRDRFIGFVRRCEMFGWSGAHDRLLELTRELAQLTPAEAHRSVAEWFSAGGATFVDDRVWAMLDSALGKYPADVIVAPVEQSNSASTGAPHRTGATTGSHAGVGPAGQSTSQRAGAGGDADHDTPAGPRRLPMIPGPVWDAYGWTRSIRARARTADVCPDAVLGAMLATYAARIPAGVRIVTGTKMPLGTNLVVSLVGPSGSDKSTAFTLAQRIAPGSAVPVYNNPGSGEAFAASFVHPDPDGEGAVAKRTKVLKPDPRALFYVAEGGLIQGIESRGRGASTWLPHLRSLAVDESLSTTNATAEVNRQVPAMSYSAGVVVGFQVTTAGAVLHDTGTGTAQRFLWFTSLSTEDLPPGSGLDVPDVPMETPVLTRLAEGMDDHNNTVHYLTVTQRITDLIRAEQRHTRLTRDITATDDHDAHRHTLVAKLAALAVLADGRVMIEDGDWSWACALYDASAAVREELLAVAEDTDRARRAQEGSRQGETDRARRNHDTDEARVAEVILRKLSKVGNAGRRQLRDAVAGRDRHLFSPALEQLETHGYVARDAEGKFYAVSPNG